MFILLPLSDEGLPKNIDEKIQIIHTIMDRALELGFHKEDIVVDGLVATIGANKNAAIETLDTISYCHDQLELATICGLSNISFGLPERSYVNTYFLTMAISRGLTMAIANPSQDLLMHAAFASDLLMNHPGADIRYINRMNAVKEQQSGESMAAAAVVLTPGEKIFEAVMKGSQGSIINLVKEGLDAGIMPDDMIQKHLITAIQKVGVLFEEKKYYYKLRGG